MQSYQSDFIHLAIEHQVLKFGEFTLKSGRQSPYFFNAGEFHQASALATVGRIYAQALVASKLDVDMIFGPAYKGIPLASATAIALYNEHQIDLPYCFNRKEAKDHGEGGSLVGAPLQGRVLIVDDVITAGTAVREVLELIDAAEASPAAILIGLDRQERGQGEQSAIQEIEEKLNIPVASIITLADIMTYLESAGGQDDLLDRIDQYRKHYGI